MSTNNALKIKLFSFEQVVRLYYSKLLGYEHYSMLLTPLVPLSSIALHHAMLSEGAVYHEPIADRSPLIGA